MTFRQPVTPSASPCLATLAWLHFLKMSLLGPLCESSASPMSESEEGLKVELRTTPVDKRFSNTNQARHCYSFYNAFHQCVYENDGNDEPCFELKRHYASICPTKWVENWNDQREAGTYAGPVPGEGDKKAAGH
ncbi:cytochrome c oxidase, subunit VIb [Pavlovales sp. CCMP2436]|nr:cytochrome c oxidase, subunit VIb [Pavlovales sp. CCMP2436]